MRFQILLMAMLCMWFSSELHAQNDTINQLDHIGRRVGLWVWNDVSGKTYRKAWYSEAGEDSSVFVGLNGKPHNDITLADELLLSGDIHVDSLKQIHAAVMATIKAHYEMPPEGAGLVVVSFLANPDKTISQLRLIQGITPEINLQVYESVQKMDTRVLSCCLVSDKPMLIFLPLKF